MAFTKRQSRKCPVCVGCTPTKIQEIDKALADLLRTVKETGEIPRAIDQRFNVIAHATGTAPHSLHFHLSKCLVDLEIQDQRLLEYKDLVSAVDTAKNEYLGNPTMQLATAYSTLLDREEALAKAIEGQQDPVTTVEYMVETVINPLTRQTLAAVTQELRVVRDMMTSLVSANQTSHVRAQVDAALHRIAGRLKTSAAESLTNTCSYYKVELDAKARRRAIDSAAERPVDGTLGHDDNLVVQ